MLARFVRRFAEADLEHLPRIVPLVSGEIDVQSLITLQADELGAESLGQYLGDLGLAGAGLTLEEQRSRELQCEKHRGRELTVGDVVLIEQPLTRFLDRGGQARPRSHASSLDISATVLNAPRGAPESG